jgi:hypothetical protein
VAYGPGATQVSRTQVVTLGLKDASVSGPKLAVPLNVGVISPTSNALHLYNGTTPQALYVYNTYTNSSNYERFRIEWASNQISLSNQAAGTGIGRPLIIDGGSGTLYVTAGNAVRLQTNAATRWGVEGSAGHLVPGADNTYDLGWPSQRPRDLNLGRNLVLNTGSRILADWTSGTIANRVMFQNSVTNGSTSVGVIPNGTSQDSGFAAWGRADPTNSPYGTLSISTAAVSLVSAAVGTGVVLPLAFVTGGAERMRIETNGDVLMAQQGLLRSTSSNTGIRFQYQISAANGGVVELITGRTGTSPTGIVMINASNQASIAMIYIGGGRQTTALIYQAIPGGVGYQYSVAKDTANSHNVYYSGSRYELQNLSGGSQNYNVLFFPLE